MSDVCCECETAEDDEWIQCDDCDFWIHFGCIPLPRHELRKMERFYCSKCRKARGISLDDLTVRPKRRRTRLNYAKLNDGIVEMDRTHPHTRYFQEIEHQNGGNNPVKQESAASIPHEITEPTLVRGTPEELGMSVPHSLTPRHVADLLGPDLPIPVMDVVTQDPHDGWNIGKWADYFETESEKREQTLNVISLEFGSTPLRKEFERPKWVRDHDIVDMVWDEKEENRPNVAFYCLMGVKGCFTDFHVDFGGTSVFYHVISGRKQFAFLPPTKKNLSAFEKWCRSPAQSYTWFPSLAQGLSIVSLGPGDTLLIPSGWIHAVYTPEDTVVFGGNFLMASSTDAQIVVDAMEQRTNVGMEYKFPHFRETMSRYAKLLKNNNEHVPEALLQFLPA